METRLSLFYPLSAALSLSGCGILAPDTGNAGFAEARPITAPTSTTPQEGGGVPAAAPASPGGGDRSTAGGATTGGVTTGGVTTGGVTTGGVTTGGATTGGATTGTSTTGGAVGNATLRGTFQER